MTAKERTRAEGHRPKGEGKQANGGGQANSGKGQRPKREGGQRKSGEGGQRRGSEDRQPKGEDQQRKGGEGRQRRGGEGHHLGHSTALGRAIRLVRNSQELSRAELAERTGLSYPYVSEIEGGKKGGSSRSLMLIAEALSTRLHDLLEMADTLETGEPATALKGIVDRSQKGTSGGSPWFRDPGHHRGVDAMTGPTYSVANMPPPPMHLMDEKADDAHVRREVHDLVDRLPSADLQLVLRLIYRLTEQG